MNSTHGSCFTHKAQLTGKKGVLLVIEIWKIETKIRQKKNTKAPKQTYNSEMSESRDINKIQNWKPIYIHIL